MIRLYPKVLIVFSLLVVNISFSSEKTYHYNIPAQSLNNALVKFAIDSNLTLVFTADMVRGIKAHALIGEMTDKAALEQLLHGSGFNYHFVGTRTVTLILNTEAEDSEYKPTEPVFIPNTVKVLRPITILAKENTSNAKFKTSYRTTYTNSGTKTNTPIRQIPRSIQILSQPIIEDQQNLSISESLKNVSGIVTDHPLITPSFDSTLIRGFKAEQLLDGSTQYYNPGDRESLVNIERIEVIKGSNALLYSGGSGSPAGGLVNIVSKLPQPLAHYDVGMKYGSYQFYQPYFDLNQPVNENILFRLTGEYTHSASHINTVNTERYNINSALTISNSETTFTLQGKVSRWEQPDYQGLPAVGTIAGDFSIPAETFVGPKDIEPSQAEFYGVWGGLEHSFNEVWSLALKARYTRSEFDQKVQALIGSDGVQADQPIAPPSTWALVNTELFQEQEEVSLAANMTAKFNLYPTENTLLLGVDYSVINDQGFFNVDRGGTGFVDLVSPTFSEKYIQPGASKNALFVKNITYGGYFQLQSSIYDRIHLVAGVRLGNVSIDYKNNSLITGFSTKSNKLKLLPQIG